MTTGWSWSGGSGEVKFRAQGRTAVIRDRVLCRRFAAWLADKLYEVQPDVLLLEAPYLNVSRPNAARVLFAMRGVALAVVADVEVREVTPRAWQAWAKTQGWAKHPGDGGHVRDASYMRRYYETLA